VRRFAAAPHERTAVPSIVTTLFPHLPRADLATFRIALGFGLAVVVALAIARLYPVAVGVSAAIVPVLTWLYLDDVDVYEEAPAKVAGVMALSGAAGGVVAGVLAQRVAATPDTLASVTTSQALWLAVAVPAIAIVIGSIGPVLYLRRPRYDDVLDGVTFGAIAGATLSGALVLSSSSDLLSSGLRPVGAVGPWVADLVALSLLLPLVYATAMAGAFAATWLRVRAPERDRARLGALGSPVVAWILAFGVVVAASLARLWLNVYVALVVTAVITALGLIWLRLTIHLGLQEEAAEIHTGDPITCPNCRQPTLHHSFCQNCGVSLRALPKATHSHAIPIVKVDP
jgi:hypothetical protein